MAFAIYSAKPGKHGLAGLTHIAFGETEDEARENLEAHADVCPKFGPAYRNGKTIEVVTEIDEIPQFDERSIEDFIGIDDEEDETEHKPW
jgi:predicted RNase H-like HicB family nuclease